MSKSPFSQSGALLEQSGLMPDDMNITVLGSRWLDPHENLIARDLVAVKSIQKWIEQHSFNEYSNADESFFPALHQDGRYGVLFEVEFMDGFTPTEELIEDARNAVRSPGEFTYVSAGDHDRTYMGRAAIWVFFPGRFFDVKALEATALAINNMIY